MRFLRERKFYSELINFYENPNCICKYILIFIYDLKNF